MNCVVEPFDASDEVLTKSEVSERSETHSRVASKNFALYHGLKAVVCFTVIWAQIIDCSVSVQTIYAPGISFPGKTEEYFKPAFFDTENFCVAEFNDMSPTVSYWNQLIRWVVSWLGEPLYNRQSCLGQSNDIDGIKACVDKSGAANIILFGLCRGAAACLNYQAKYNNPRVKAIVIDSGVFNVKQAYTQIAPKFIDIKKVFPCFSVHDAEPIASVALIKNKEIGILILHADKDSVVSFSQAQEFYKVCQGLHFTNLFLERFDSAKHCKIFKEKPDQYLRAINEFYTKLNFE